jgi:hypothetical protein
MLTLILLFAMIDYMTMGVLMKNLLNTLFAIITFQQESVIGIESARSERILSPHALCFIVRSQFMVS